jgi:malate dehydrogenase (oxaloacetate-decarboxylating)
VSICGLALVVFSNELFLITENRCFDKPGLLLESMKDDLTPAQHPYARKDSEWKGKDHKDLESIVREVKPHILIGCSTKPKIFTEQVVKEMVKHTDRPLIFPLSNPTQLHEAAPADLIEWTQGKALISTGSPFDPIEHNGETFEIAECNNAIIYPGIGLGAVLSRTKLILTALLVAATKALAAQSPSLEDDKKGLLPDVTDARKVSVKVAAAVIRKAQEEHLAQIQSIPDGEEDLEKWIKEQMWDAEYRVLHKI